MSEVGLDNFEEYFGKTFTVCQRHIDFLENINKNTSLALRTLLDSLSRQNKKLEIKKIIDESLFFICFGLVFFILALLSTDFVSVICTGIGIFILSYGLIGGVFGALSRTKGRN